MDPKVSTPVYIYILLRSIYIQGDLRRGGMTPACGSAKARVGHERYSIGESVTSNEPSRPGLGSPCAVGSRRIDYGPFVPHSGSVESGHIACPEISNSIRCSTSQELQQRMSLTVT